MKAATILFAFFALLGVAAIAGPAPSSSSQSHEEFAAVGQMPPIAGSPMVGSGAIANITISIDSYSSDEEARTMSEAFTKGQHKALRKSLEKASIKARISFEGRSGFYELKLLRSKKTANGREIFGIGERSVRFLDAYYSGRSHLEEFGIIQLQLTSNNGVEEGSGTLIHKAAIKTLSPDAVVLDNQAIDTVRLTVRKQ